MVDRLYYVSAVGLLFPVQTPTTLLCASAVTYSTQALLFFSAESKRPAGLSHKGGPFQTSIRSRHILPLFHATKRETPGVLTRSWPPHPYPSRAVGVSNGLLKDCSVCQEGYAPGLSFSCNSCSDSSGVMALAIVLIIIIVSFVVAVLFDLTVVGTAASPPSGHGCGARLTRLKAKFPFQSLKIAVVSWQIITQASTYVSTGARCTHRSNHTRPPLSREPTLSRRPD